VYLCGPGISKWDREAAREANTAPQPRFIEMALATLRQIGVPDARIKRESYG
jgi:3-ketosteroid 9alpha-monooxygenase subunit B